MAKKFRAYRACDTDLTKVKYPCGVMPKIDGVRGLNPYGTLLSRTLMLMPNVHTREVFSKPEYVGIDGELAAGLDTDDDLCRKTTSAVTSHEGQPVVTWYAFDLCAESVCNKTYEERYAMLKQWVEFQNSIGKMLDVIVVPLYIVNNEEELLEWENIWLEMGYEGIIVRDLKAKYKWGRSTQRENGYTRRKPYADLEAELIDIFEAEENQNEAYIDAQGLSKRSTHQENKVGKGMAGALLVKRLDNGDIERVGPGKLTHEERYEIWKNRLAVLAEKRIVKIRVFPKGVKDKLRQARYIAWRSECDILPVEDDE